MANRFLNNIRINDAYTFPASDGTNGQVITTDGSGNLTFADQAGGVATSALSLNVTVKNVSGGSLSKGTIVHAAPTATPPSGNVVEVIAADYDTSTSMPAIGVLNETIANEAQGEAIMFGALSGIDTSSFGIGDELWVGNNGAFTNTKPATAGQLIQKIAVVIKSHATNGLIKVFGAGRTNDVPLPLYIDNTNQRVGIGISSPTSVLDIKNDTTNTYTLKFTASDGGHMGGMYQDGGNNAELYLANGSSTNTILINSSGNSYFNGGNIGIGTATPSEKLTISGGYIKVVDNAYDEYFLSKERTDGTQLVGFQSHSLGALSIHANGGEKIRIDSSGQVGIGTTSPSVQLDIENSGNVLIDLNTTTANANTTIRFQEGGSNTATIGYNGTNDGLILTTGGFTAGNGIFIDNAQNVGIGTATPNASYKLDISGNTRTTGNLVGGSIYSTNGIYVFGGSSTLGEYIQSSGNDINFIAGGSTRFHIDGDAGNVGIGTTIPGATLDVNGAIVSRGGTYNAGTDTRTDAGLVIQEGNYVYTQDGSYLRKLIGKTTGDVIEVGQSGTSLISSINLLPGTAGNSAVNINGNTVWNAGNDGSGSGLDADLLDGYQTASSGNWFGVIPFIHTDGVMEIGKYIDFHDTDTGTSDNDYRLTSSAGSLTGSGDFSISTNNFTAGSATIGGTLTVDRVNINSTVNSSFLTGNSLLSADGYIMVKGIVNTAETGTLPAAIVFGDGSTYDLDKISLVTNGATRLFIGSSGNIDISQSLDIAGSATISGILLEDSSDRSGLLEINQKGASAWTGIQINHGSTLWSFMSNASNVGVYDDTNSKWAWIAQPNAGIELLFNGAKQAETENGYFLATNQMRSPIYYDSNNTAYYIDPASTSEVVTLNAENIQRDIAQAVGWVPAYSNSNINTVRWNSTELAMELQADADVSAGAAFRAVRAKAGDKVRFTITLKGNTASTTGLYLRIYYYAGDLPDGKTHVSNDASYSFVQEDTGGITNWVENQAVPTTWTTYEYTYTMPSDGYVSLITLNWTGHGSNSIYYKTPDIQFEKVNDSDLLDGQQGSYYLDYNNFTNTPTGGGGASSLNDLSDVTVNTTSSNLWMINTEPASYAGLRNITIGEGANDGIVDSDDIVVIGYRAGYSLPIGSDSVVIGNQAARYGSNIRSVIIGDRAGYGTTTKTPGSQSVLIGGNAGYSMTSLSAVGVGYYALQNSTGTGNVGIGVYAGASDAVSTNNVYVGRDAGRYGGTSSNQNTVIGAFAGQYMGFDNTASYNNVLIGAYAAAGGVSVGSDHIGSDNVIIGGEAMKYGNENVDQCVYVGAGAGGDLSGTNPRGSGQNCIVIGYQAQSTSNTVTNEITLGNSSISTLRCNVTSITSLSDQRDKSDIQDSNYGLNVIEKLRPVTFEWNQRDGKRVGVKEIGFIAQELQQVDDEYLNLVYDENPEKLEASQGKLIPILVKSIQELKSEIESLKKELNTLK